MQISQLAPKLIRKKYLRKKKAPPAKVTPGESDLARQGNPGGDLP
jgi:hypothetical protein